MSLATHLILDQKVKDQGHMVIKHISGPIELKSIERPA